MEQEVEVEQAVIERKHKRKANEENLTENNGREIKLKRVDAFKKNESMSFKAEIVEAEEEEEEHYPVIEEHAPVPFLTREELMAKLERRQIRHEKRMRKEARRIARDENLIYLS